MSPWWALGRARFGLVGRVLVTVTVAVGALRELRKAGIVATTVFAVNIIVLLGRCRVRDENARGPPCQEAVGAARRSERAGLLGMPSKQRNVWHVK